MRSLTSNLRKDNIGLGDGLAPNRWQSIIYTDVN